MTEQTTLEIVFNDWEKIIEDIRKNGVTLANQRALIQEKKRFIIAIGQARKDIKDQRLTLSIKENKDKQSYISEGMAKTPAGDQAKEMSRPARCELEKLEIDIETMQDLAMNWNYHLRINEIDINKVWVWQDQI